MPKGQHLTAYQQGIVRRYYQHQEDLAQQTLGELVSDLYLAEAEGDAKKSKRLWKSAHSALLRAGAEAALVEDVVQRRDLKAFGKLVEELF